MRKLLIVVNDFAFFVSHRLSLSEAALAAGFDVHVAVPLPANIPEELRQKFTFHSIRIRRKSISIVGEFQTLVSLFRVYQKVCPDISHQFTIKPVIYGTFVASLLGVSKVVNTVTGLGFVFVQSGVVAEIFRSFVSVLYRVALKRSRVATIFQNPNDRQLFIDMRIVDEKRAFLILGSGVDPNRFRPTGRLSHECPIVLFPGRMLWDKGVGDLIEASRILKAKGVSFQLWLAGAVDLENPSGIPEQVILDWEREGLCRWLGYVDNMPQLLFESDIVCLPSYREGLPLALLEAAASARPIVTTRVPGCDLTVLDGQSGLLVPPRAPDELAAALSSLLRDESARERMGACGHKFVIEHYTQKIINEQILSLYSM